MFKYVLLFVTVALLDHYSAPPLLSTAVLVLIALGAVDDLAKSVGRTENAARRVERALAEIASLRSELNELRKDQEAAGRSASRLEWLAHNRSDVPETHRLAEDLESVLCRLDSLEAEMVLRRPTKAS